MKILYIITRSDHGGAQVAVLDLVRNLPSEYRPVVAAGEYGFLQEECDKVGIPFRYVPGLVQPMRPFRDLKALWYLRGMIRRVKPDIVHVHTSKAGLLGRVAAWLNGTPSVFTAHTWSFDEGVPRLRRWISIPLERMAATLCDKIITVSDANTEKAIRSSVTKRSNLVRIWNGVPDSPFRAAPGTHSTPTIIMVARMVPQKDFANLLEAVSTLPGKWRMKLVGDGPNRPHLQAQCTALGLDERVEFLGNREDVAMLLSQADIFVLSTNWEGLPISILEGMRAGLPVVASDVGGVKEQVIHGETGFITRPRDPADLRAHLQVLLESPGFMARMGEAGRRRFEAEFRIDMSVNKTVEIYQSVCRSGADVPIYMASEEPS